MLDEKDIQILKEMFAGQREELRAEMADMRDGLRMEMADMKVELKEEFRSEFVPQITDEVTRRMSILLDADVNRKLDLILEELAILRETKVSVEDYQKQYDRVDARLSALEAGYRQMSRDMAELKQAN